MDYFARLGYDTWCVDMEGYGRSDKHRDDQLRHRQRRRRPRGGDRLHRADARRRSFLCTASRRARCGRRSSPSATPSASARLALDAFVWTGQGQPDAGRAHASGCRSSGRKNRRPIDRAFVRSIFTRDHPGTADDEVIEAFADAILALDDSVPTGTYVDMCANLPVVDPGAHHGAHHRHARPVRRHRQASRTSSSSSRGCPTRTSSSPSCRASPTPASTRRTSGSPTTSCTSFFSQPAPVYRGA